MPSIKPQEKTTKRTFSLPVSLAEWIDSYAKSLNDSDPDYIVSTVLERFRAQEKKAAAAPEEAPKEAGAVVGKPGKAA